MNLNPNMIKSGNKIYYDCAIIHSNQYLGLALLIAKYVYNVVSKEVYRDQKLVDRTKESVTVPQNEGVGPAIGENISPDNIVPVEQVTESNSPTDSIPADNKPDGNLE